MKKALMALAALSTTMALPTAAHAEWWRGQPVPFTPCFTILAFGQVFIDLPCTGKRDR